MSSILKALRKLEEEKRGGKFEAPDLRVDQGQSVSKNRPFVPLAAGIVCGAAMVGLFFLVPGGPEQTPKIAQNEPRTPVATVAEQARPLPQAATVKPVSPEIAAPSQDAAPTSVKSESAAEVAASGKVPGVSEGGSTESAAVSSQVQRVPQTVAGQPVRPKTTAAAPPPASAPVTANPETAEATTAPGKDPGVSEDRSTDNSAAESQAQNEQRADIVVAAQPSVADAVPNPSPTTALPAGIRLQVSEIYYQGDLNSMAVVNDLPVMVGSHIDSALVTEIQSDRVLFEIDGEVFTVSPPQP